MNKLFARLVGMFALLVSFNAFAVQTTCWVGARGGEPKTVVFTASWDSYDVYWGYMTIDREVTSPIPMHPSPQNGDIYSPDSVDTVVPDPFPGIWEWEGEAWIYDWYYLEPVYFDECDNSTVFQEPEVDVTISPGSINDGDTGTLTVSTDVGDDIEGLQCTISGPAINASINPNSSQQYAVKYSWRGTYTVSCSNIFGSDSDQASLTVTCTEPTTYTALTTSNSCADRMQNSSVQHEIDGCSYSPDSLLMYYVVTGQTNFNLYVENVAFGSDLGTVNSTVAAAQTLPCNVHDICYQTCGSNKASCDVGMESGITAQCDIAYPAVCPHGNSTLCAQYSAERYYCQGIGGVYTAAVGGSFGDGIFEGRQLEYCKCCN